MAILCSWYIKKSSALEIIFKKTELLGLNIFSQFTPNDIGLNIKQCRLSFSTMSGSGWIYCCNMQLYWNLGLICSGKQIIYL